MRVGVTGHQHRDGADWSWVHATLRSELRNIRFPLHGYSSLAAGADQAFARTILEFGGIHHAVIPLEDYAQQFDDPRALETFHSLLSRSREIRLHGIENPERAFFEAGAWIVDHVDLLIAIWDGEPAKGFGGTADVVALARDRSLDTIILDPIAKTVSRSPICR